MIIVQLPLAGLTVVQDLKVAQEPLVAQVMSGGLHSILQQMGPLLVIQGPKVPMLIATMTVSQHKMEILFTVQMLVADAHQISCHLHHRAVTQCINTRHID